MFINKFYKFVACGFLCTLALIPAIAHAQVATVICAGTVAELGIHSPGKVYVRLNSMNVGVMICSMDSEWGIAGTQYGNTSVSTCKALYATLLAAKVAQTPIQAMYIDGNVPSTCSGFLPWSPVSVRFTDF